MSNGRKQFAVYRLKKGLWENEALRYRSWNYLQKFHIQVQSDRYEQICVSPFLWDLDPSDLRRQLENGLPAAPSGEKLEVSDVLGSAMYLRLRRMGSLRHTMWIRRS